MNYKMILQYDGTRYNGWQKQGNTDNTIQGKLETLLSRIAGEPVEIHGAGRTDAGVHAAGQVANAKFHTDLSDEELLQTINIICRKTSKSPASRGCRSASTAV